MFKYIYNELLKLSSNKFILVLIIIMLICNGSFCIYNSQNSKNNLPKNVINNFISLYIDSPEDIISDYEILQAYENEQYNLWSKQIELGNYEYEIQKAPSKYAPEGFSDAQLFSEVFGRVEAINRYGSVIQKVIDRANVNLAEFTAMGISPQAYTYKYQLRVIDLYKIVQTNVHMELEYTRGWDAYFSYDIVNIFIFAMLIIVGTLVFAQEKNFGFMPIIRVSKNGRIKTALAKVVAMIIITAGIVLVFTAETWLIFGLRLGYGSPFNAIQIYDDFTLSPYIISVGEYFAVTLAVKLAAFMLFAAVIMAVSVFVYNYAVIYIVGLGFFGFNFLLYTISYINADNPLKNLNLVATAAVNPLFVRYRAINIFGNVVGYVPFMCVVFAAMFVTAVAVTVWKYNRGAEAVNVKWLSAVISKTNLILSKFKCNRIQPKHTHSYSLSLFHAETYKTLVATRFILIVVALLLVKGYISYGEYQPRKSYADAVYKEYMTTLAGEMTDEKRQYLADERAMINETLAKQQSMQESYINEEITFDEYRAYLTDYNYAYSRNEYLTAIENHAAYIDARAAEGYEAWFVYDTGWKTLLFTNFDWTMYAALHLLFSGIFANEYDSRSSSGGFAQILRTSKHGRKRTFKTKLLSSTAITTVMTIIWNILDYILIARAYAMPLTSAPLQSIETFGATDLTITIENYLMIFWILRVFAAVMLTFLICTLSEILRKNIMTMAVTVMLTLFPALLSYFGLSVFSHIDFTAMMRVTPLILLGVVSYAVFLTVAATMVLGLTFSAKRMWIE